MAIMAHKRSPNTFDSFATERISCRRRRDIVRIVHSTWTDGGTDDSGLAVPLLDGRVDVLGLYLIHQLFDKSDLEDILLEDASLEIDRLDPSNVSYQDFYSLYMSKNEPVLITRGLTDDWPATVYWTTSNESHPKPKPNLKYISRHFGQDTITTHVQSSRGFMGSTNSPRQTVDMTLDQYALWWDEYSLRVQQQSCSTDTSLIEPMYYMKDWKFVAAHKNYTAYTTPHYFRDDWLNASSNLVHTSKPHATLQAMGDAYKFCYLGPAGSITPLHADVLNSYSWSSNICGCKQWWMVPPKLSYLLYDSLGKKLAPHLHSDLDLGDLGTTIYPGLSLARKHSLTFLQQDGETVFVPSGWHHTVENIEDTLSINHNWINGTNIDWSWDKVWSECKTLTITTTTNQVENGSTQQESTRHLHPVMDDFYLLFIIMEKKARITMSEISNQHESSDDWWFNLNKILDILESMHQCLMAYSQSDILKVTPDDVLSLKLQVQQYVDTNNKSL